jgi:hypothetical protein
MLGLSLAGSAMASDVALLIAVGNFAATHRLSPLSCARLMSLQETD